MDKNNRLINGNILSYLGWGLGAIREVQRAGVLDLLFDYDIKSTSVIRVTVEVTSDLTGNVLYSSSSESDNETSDFLSDSDVIDSQMSLMEIAAAYSQRSDIRNFLSMDPLSLTLSIYDAFTDEGVTVESKMSGMAIGTFEAMLSSTINEALSSIATTTNLLEALSLGMIAGAIAGELMEMALGLDNHFGPGGQLVGESIAGKAYYTAPVSFADYITDSLPSWMGGTNIELNNAIDLKNEIAMDNWGLLNEFGLDSYTTLEELNEAYPEYGPMTQAESEAAGYTDYGEVTDAEFNEAESSFDYDSGGDDGGDDGGGASTGSYTGTGTGSFAGYEGYSGTSGTGWGD